MQRMENDDVESAPAVIGGGLSALALSGLAQYLSLGSTPHTHLYSQDKLPAWLARLSLAMEFERHGTSRLWPDWLSQDKAFLKEHEWQAELPPVYFSCPEKAMLELLMDLPGVITFEHANELMQGLVNLSPGKLDA